MTNIGKKTSSGENLRFRNVKASVRCVGRYRYEGITAGNFACLSGMILLMPVIWYLPARLRKRLAQGV